MSVAAVHLRSQHHHIAAGLHRRSRPPPLGRYILGCMEKGIQTPMAQGRSTKTPGLCGGLGPVGCQKRTLSLDPLRISLEKGLANPGPLSKNNCGTPMKYRVLEVLFWHCRMLGGSNVYQVLHWNLGKGSRNRCFAAQIHSVARLREFPRVAVLTLGRVWAATWNSATSSTARPDG